MVTRKKSPLPTNAQSIHPPDPEALTSESRSRVAGVHDLLAEKTHHLRIINDMAINLLHVDSLNDVLWLISRGAIANLGFDDCVIYLADEANGRLVQRAAFGPKNPYSRKIKDPITIPFGEGIVGTVAASGKPVIVDDTRTDGRYIVDDAQRLSEIAVPIIHEDRVIGVIDSENDRAGFYTDAHLEVLTIIASITSAKLASCLTVETLRRTVKELEQTSEKLRAREGQLEKLARHDALTHLLNRRELMHHGDALLQIARSSGEPATLWYMDLDQFRLVNTRFGHGGGDALLIGVAQTLTAVIGNDGIVTRIGGDEFVVLLPDSTVDSARWRCERLIQTVAQTSYPYANHRITTSLSVGIAEINRGSTSLGDVLEAADKANYIAKKSGRNQYHVATATDASYRRHSDRAAWAVEVGKARESGRLSIFAQPVFSLSRPRTVMMWESLLRLKSDDGRLVTATEFLSGCEQFNQMHQVDRWVIPTVLDWIEQHGSQNTLPEISINVSGESIDDPTFPQFLLTEIHHRCIDTRNTRLCIEITETNAISNMEQARILVDVLRENHIRVALDDFGNGYASFALLKQLMPDVVKIDKMFIETLDSPVDRKIVESINDVAHEIGAITVAEGVEDPNTLQLLQQIGVEHAQGFLLSRPSPIDSLLDGEFHFTIEHAFDDISRSMNLSASN